VKAALVMASQLDDTELVKMGQFSDMIENLV
jgi:hypothetical protein